MSALDDALAVMALLVLDTGARWGDAATEAQWTDARAVLDPACATPFHFMTRARGFDKTGGVAGMAGAILLTQAPPRARCYGLASDRDQGRLFVDSLAGYAARTPELAGALAIESFRVTAKRSGATLEVLAADVAGAYGLRPYFLAVDELAQWGETEAPRRLFDATTTALAKVKGARAAVITSAGSPAHWSYRVLEHARADPLWRTHEVEGPPPWADTALLAEQERRLLPSVYARLFENRWTEGEDALATRDDVVACIGHTGDLAAEGARRYVASLDVGLVHDRCVALVAHAEDRAGGVTVVVDRLGVWQGSKRRPVDLGAVEAWLAEACRAYRAPLVYDPFQAAHLTQRLKAAGVRVEAFTFSSSSVGRLAAVLHELIRGHRLDLPDDDALVDELCSVRLRETSPGVVRMDHSSSGHDDRAIALAMAAQHLVERPPSRSGCAVGFEGRVGDGGVPVVVNPRLGAPTGASGFGGRIEIR